ncbi:hypothetical protein ACHAP5_009942 [Fusarium lateritium]
MIPTTSSTTPQKSWPSDCSTLYKTLEIDISIKPRCHGFTQANAPCTRAISKANCAVITQLLEQIVLIGSVYAAQSILAQVAHLVMCKRDHRDQGPGRLLLWESILKPLETTIIKKEDEDSKSLSEKNTENLPIFTSVVAVKQEVIPTNETPNIEHINEEIKKKLLCPLSEEETNQGGHVYIYTFPESYHDAHPYIKIGYAKDVKTRMSQWKTQCGYPPELLGQFPAEHYVKVEKLVHAQLWNQRKREKDGCPTCHVKHKEWFKVDSMTANKYIGLWTSWMRQQPYDDEGVLQDKWRLRIESFDMANPSCWELLATGVFDEDVEESKLTEEGEGDSFAWSSDEQSDFSEDDILEEVDTDDSGLYSTDDDDDDDATSEDEE